MLGSAWLPAMGECQCAGLRSLSSSCGDCSASRVRHGDPGTVTKRTGPAATEPARSRSCARGGRRARILTSGVALDIIESLLERARAAAAAIRARVAAAVDVALAAVGVTAMVFEGRLLSPSAPACRSPPPPRPRPARPPPRARPGRADRGRRHRRALPGRQRAEEAARPHVGLPPPHRPLGCGRPAAQSPTLAGRRTRSVPPAPAGPGTPDKSRLPSELGEWDIPRTPLLYYRAVIASSALTSRQSTERRTGYLSPDEGQGS